MRILVTGGCGFIGSHIVDELINRGHLVDVVDDLSTGLKENLNPRAKLYPGRVQDFFKAANYDFIFHTAALARIQPSIQDPLPAHDANVNGTLRILEIARLAGAKVIFCGSSSIYGNAPTPTSEKVLPNPGSPYALQKWQCEQYLEMYHKLYGLQYITLRYFNVYGPRQILTGAYAALIGIFLNQYKNKKPFTIVGDGTQRRDFTNVADVVAANMAAMEVLIGNRKLPHRTFNIGTGTNYSVLEVADMIDPNHPKEFLPKRPGEAKKTLASIRRAKSILYYQPQHALPVWIKKQLTSER